MDLDRVDPALRAATRRTRLPDVSRPWIRSLLRAGIRVLPVPRRDGVEVVPIRIAGQRARVYRPRARVGDAALLWVHGGGLLIGDARQDERLCAETARDLGIVVVSLNYRLAPEHPFPAAHEDVHAGWRWVQSHAVDLGVERARIVIGGESAGGGLAAGLVQRIRDEAGVQPIGQWLFAPMIDDGTAADRTLDEIDHPVWNNRFNRAGWTAYLGDRAGGANVPRYAAPARAVDVAGLPPTYLAVGDIELFFPEVREFARRLSAAGVPTTLDVVPGGPHGFESWARDTEPARALLSRAHGWLRDVVATPA
ncbi:alpha/beta hydrolase [Microbacterium invictum]|uniref:Alpha/beta hydrolase n=1 Tax=Microbacterium invictum TaxID=515415 RepID=A0ABZ0VAY3_9MICO|nr:alpha/beta hydrolase [Microbacterium invictum]WQB70053.1 alpha/beta hydrolase [Microbacterium invictum]